MTTSPTPADRPADLLRAAAEKLRAAANAAAEHSGSSVWQSVPHFPDQPDSDFTTLTAGPGRPLHKGGGRGAAPYMHAPVSEYAALMGPGVGLALAQLLDGVMSTSREADHEECQRGCSPEICDLSAALAVARQLLGTTSDDTADDTADEEREPIQLRWGLDDVMYGDDDTTTVLLSGPGGEPYWVELDPERTAALRNALAGPESAALPAPADRAEPDPSPTVLAELVGTIRDLQVLQQPLVDALRHIREDMHRAGRGGDEWAMEWMSDVWAELPLPVRAAGGDEDAVHELAAAGAYHPTEARTRIADALAAADGWEWAPSFDKTRSPSYQEFLRQADVALAALATPVVPAAPEETR